MEIKKVTDLPGKFAIDVDDRNSRLHKKIMGYLDYHISSLREKNDGDLDQEQTWKTRGRITEVKKLKAMLDPKKFKTSKDKIKVEDNVPLNY